MLGAAVAFASKDEARYYLNGVCLEIDARGVTYVATDGHRMIAYRDDMEDPEAPDNLLTRQVHHPDGALQAAQAGKGGHRHRQDLRRRPPDHRARFLRRHVPADRWRLSGLAQDRAGNPGFRIDGPVQSEAALCLHEICGPGRSCQRHSSRTTASRPRRSSGIPAAPTLSASSCRSNSRMRSRDRCRIGRRGGDHEQADIEDAA
jgi:hypothetical protein